MSVRLDRAAVTRERLAADGVRKIIDELGRRVGPTKRLRPHGLRHAAIIQVLDRNGGEPRVAARVYRHKDIRTASISDDNRADLAGNMVDLISEE